MFKPYEARPVTRMAVEITGPVTQIGESTFEYAGVTFKAYEQPVHGDYVVRLTETDAYHCACVVSHERNIVTD